MNARTTLLALFVIALCLASASARRHRFRSRRRMRPAVQCSGSAMYDVTFYNMLTTGRFSNLPEGGLVFSPMTAVTHTPRFSALVVRGFASPPVEEVCETGDNTNLLAAAMSSGATESVVGADGPVPSGGNLTVRVTANCEHPYLTVLSMIAPSPDWIVQLSNMPLLRRGRFIRGRKGYLIAYDCGTDDGGNFTAPMDTSLDMPTDPAENIAPLVEDDTDPFMGRVVGKYSIRRVMN